MSLKTLSKEEKEEFINPKTKRHLDAKPNYEVFLYFPNQKEEIKFDPKEPTKTVRMIFEGGVTFNQYETKKLKELSAEIEKLSETKKFRQFIYPKDWDESKSLRFLQATGYKLDKTIEMLLNHFEWRSKNIPPHITENAMKILNSGFIYIHGRDNHFRPVMVLRCSEFMKNRKIFCFEDWEKAVIFFMEYSINELLLPGQIENWVSICDINQISLTSIPSELKRILGILQDNYRCRLYVMWIVNVSGWVKLLWRVIKGLIDNCTERKIKFLKNENLSEIFDLVDRSQVEKRYGGESETITEHFFPPKFPNKEYFKDSEKIKKVLVGENEYLKKINANPKLKRSPFLSSPGIIKSTKSDGTCMK